MKELNQETIDKVVTYLDDNLEMFGIEKDDTEYYNFFDSSVNIPLMTDKEVARILYNRYPLDGLMEIIDEITSVDYYSEREAIVKSIVDSLIENVDGFKDYRDGIIEGWSEEEDLNEWLKEEKSDSQEDFEEDFEEELTEWLEGHISIIYNLDHIYNQPICINITVDAGDCKYDFTLNRIKRRSDEEIESGIEKYYLSDKSGLLWLVNQQGYSSKDIESVIKESLDANFGQRENRFLQSVLLEINNVTSEMNVLTFLVNMRLEDAMNIRENKSDISLNKEVTCGLYDPWNGAGSLFEIELERDVYIPYEMIDSTQIDGWRGVYGIKEIYCAGEDFWSNNVLM